MHGPADALRLPLSTIAVVLLLGPCVVLWALVEVLARVRGSGKYGETTLALLRCTTIMAAVLFLCYWCEHGFPNKSMTKTYRPAMYWGSFGVLILVSLLSVRKCKTTGFMNREQTEEWKGWMQFLFIQYHYWKMETAYKDIRIYITCYLWMTGFGNFSFFATKGDFGALRVLQMVWRMNFFVFFLCLTMNNPYIVYYICPLHTFFFFVTYVTMAVWSHVNTSRYGLMAKCVVCAGLFWLVYDLVPRCFHPIFGWLGTQPTRAAIGGHGVEWEWYFRSFLDHFSTIWGMVFALNMPFLAAWFKKVETLSLQREWGAKLSLLAAMAAIFILWVHYVYSRDKSQYNNVHAYYGIVPLLSYLLLRNISKTVRGYYFHVLHWFGTITLETYLLQYHIWLADNAGRLLNIVPGQWFLTFVIASLIHVLCATQVFNVTNKLRDIVLPNDLGVALRNLAWLIGAVVVSLLAARAIVTAELAPWHLVWVVLCVAAFALVLLHLPRPEGKIASSVSWVAQKHHSLHLVKLANGAAFLAGLVVVNRLVVAARRPVTGRSTPAFLTLNSAEVRLYESTGFHSALRMDYLLDSTMLCADSWQAGRLAGFVIGSLAQRWHGLVCTAAVVWCVAICDPYFGLARLFLFLWAPEGRKTISHEEAYGPPKAKPGQPDAEEGHAAVATEQTPLTAKPAASAA